LAEKMSITIQQVRTPLRGSIRPPGSKSITNRALVCAALADGASTLAGALDSEDTQVMIASLRQLGIEVESQNEGRTLLVPGCNGQIPAAQADLFVGNSGTTIRFLTALCSLGRGTYRLDGIERMRERPIGDLANALRQLGVVVRYERNEGFPPLVVEGVGLRSAAGPLAASVRGDISSQFLSGLLLAAGGAGREVKIAVEGELVSQPYVAMTLEIMRSFGISVEARESRTFRVGRAERTYRAREYAIEPDASAASYFWGAAAITGGAVTVEGLTRDSLQGDVQFVDCLAKMGCKVEHAAGGILVSGRAQHGVDIEMNAISDTVQTLAVVAIFADGPTTIRGVGHIRHKETDRIGDLARELRKFGATVEERSDGLTIHPLAAAQQPPAVEIETYHDHRMAMSFSLAGLARPGIIITNPACTAKTYPAFLEDLERLTHSKNSGL
jgi:3-phosphoshikimate 1-carboxyvinyltransferase